MRKGVVLTLMLAAVLAAVLTAGATAKWSVFRVGNLILKAEGKVSPTTLPRDEFAPTSFHGRGRIETVDGTHPPAIREGLLYIDRDGGFDAKGLPVCRAGQLEARDTKSAKRVCGDAIVGSGIGTAEIAFPEQRPIVVHSPLILFNGGERGGTLTLFVHAYITVPTPAAIVTSFKFSKVHVGQYGLRGVFQIPVIAGGSGSVTGFEFRIERHYHYKGRMKSYDLGKCPDGHIDVKGEGVFKDEVGDGGETSVGGAIVFPCKPKGRRVGTVVASWAYRSLHDRIAG
jgi:hypothetical protein